MARSTTLCHASHGKLSTWCCDEISQNVVSARLHLGDRVALEILSLTLFLLWRRVRSFEFFSPSLSNTNFSINFSNESSIIFETLSSCLFLFYFFIFLKYLFILHLELISNQLLQSITSNQIAGKILKQFI